MSSIAAPQMHSGLKHSKLCLNHCSFKGLNLTRSLVSILTPCISKMLWTGFFIGRMICSKFLLKTEMEGETDCPT